MDEKKESGTIVPFRPRNPLEGIEDFFAGIKPPSQEWVEARNKKLKEDQAKYRRMQILAQNLDTESLYRFVETHIKTQ